MFRKTFLALLAVAVVGLSSSTGAHARGGFHGGGFHGGGFHGGGWGGIGAFGWGLGFGLPYFYGGPYYYGYPDYYGDCYLVRQRVLTRYGWRIRRVEVCD